MEKTLPYTLPPVSINMYNNWGDYELIIDETKHVRYVT
jgi:hypothetical protein